MTATRTQTVTPSPRLLIRSFWMLHREAYRLTGGRFGLSRPEAGSKFGMLRLATVGRRSGEPRIAIVGYYEDGPNLVTLAMNGWGEREPGWWLNLQANPDTSVVLADGSRGVRARAATGPERDRLWARFREFRGWGDDIDALAARRPNETAVVVFEPRPGNGAGVLEAGGASALGREQRADPVPPAALATGTYGGRRLRPGLRHLWIVPGLAIAFFANGQATNLGLGIIPPLVFGIAPDLTRLLGLGQAHSHGQMAARAIPAFNLMHHPAPPLVMLALSSIGVLPSALYVGAIAWLGHIVVGLGVGDRLRRRDGFLQPLSAIGQRAVRSVAPDRPRASAPAERAA
jgi:F420H(2)-dependent quinone reductase